MNNDRHQKTIDRLTRKIMILETMIEDRSRQSYYEAIQRSIINNLLELSLRADSVDQFLFQVLDLLFSAESLNIEKKGALFLYDDATRQMTIQTHRQIEATELDAYRTLPVSDEFLRNLQTRDIFHDTPGETFPDRSDGMPNHRRCWVPIRSGTTLHGMILLFPLTPAPEAKREHKFFTSIADICAGALDRINYSRQILGYQRLLEQKVEQQTSRLKQEKELLDVTLRSIGDGVITTNLEGKIILFNKVAEQLTGWTRQEAVNRGIEEVLRIIDEQTGLADTTSVTKALTSPRLNRTMNHAILVSRDNTRRNIEDSCAPIFNEAGKIIGTVLVFRDVTEKRKTADELAKIKKLESIGILAGGIAHDFNNILAAILGNIEIAGLTLDPSARPYALLQEAKNATIRAKGLTQQLLTFSKGGDPVKTTTSIGDTIIESTNFVLRGSPVSCRFDIPEDLWLTDIDAGQISQVMQNLALNAKQAMPSGGEITISCANIAPGSRPEQVSLPDGPFVSITVQDNGCGIDKSHLDKIFDPYFTTKEEGTGLGLSITHSIIRKHNGRITARSGPDGATFIIYLPASDKKQIVKPIGSPTDTTPTSLKILVMDDEKLVRDVACEMLENLGHKAYSASNGKEAIEQFNTHRNNNSPFDAIIMDLIIPGGLGGKETMERLLTIDPEVKVIVTSGYSNDPVMSDYRKYGFREALNKPFFLADLKDKLARLFEENQPG